MRAIDAPEFDINTVYSLCVNSIADGDLKRRLNDIHKYVEDAAKEYDARSQTLDFYLIEPNNDKSDSIIVGDVTKKELKRIYENHMVPENKPARQIYDQIRISAKKCPYCGFGHAETLDHYLPKGRFPLLCVAPKNLIPACRDCNSGSKGAALAKTKETQHLHPYFDRGIYIDDQWLRAGVVETRPLSVNYYIDPPDYWSNGAKRRVIRHFDAFKLAVRYGREASDEISAIRLTVEDCYNSGGYTVLKEELLKRSKPSEKIFINHWRTVFYQALADSDWYCNGGFKE